MIFKLKIDGKNKMDNIHISLSEIKDKIIDLEKSIKLKENEELLTTLVYDHLENGSIKDRDLFIKMINYDIVLTIKGHQKFKDDLEIARLVYDKDPNKIYFFSKEMRKNFIAKNYDSIEGGTVIDKDFFIKLIEYNRNLICKGHPDLYNDLEIAKLIFKKIPNFIKNFSEEINEKLFEMDKNSANFIADGTVTDKDFFIKLINYDSVLICKGHQDLFNDLEFAKLITQKNIKYSIYFSDEVNEKLFEIYKNIVNFIKDGTIKNKGFLIKLINYNSVLISKGHPDLYNDLEIAKLIFKKIPNFIKNFSEEINEKLFENNKDVAKFIKNGSIKNKDFIIKLINYQPELIIKAHNDLYENVKKRNFNYYNNYDIAIVVVRHCSSYIKYFSEKVKEKIFDTDPGLVFNIQVDSVTNKAFLIKLINYKPVFINRGDSDLFSNDINIALLVHSKDAKYLDYFSSKTILKIKETIELLKKDGMKLKDVDDIYKRDIATVNIAVEQNPKAIEFSLTDKVIEDKKTMMKLVEENGKYLQYASDLLKEDFEICFTAVSNFQRSLNYVSPSIKKKIKSFFC